VYPLDCPKNIVCLTTFPNINQTTKQNYPSQLEKISRYPKGNEPEVFLNTYQSSLQCDFCKPNHLVTRPATKERASPLLENFPLKKCLGHIVCITTVFVHAIDVKCDHLRSEISFSHTCNILNIISCIYHIALLQLEMLH